MKKAHKVREHCRREEKMAKQREREVCLTSAKTKVAKMCVKSEFLEKELVGKYGANWLPEGRRVLSHQQVMTVTRRGVR